MNPNMMGMQMGQMPNIPTTTELWKNEKAKYRLWMISFTIGIIIVFSLLLTSAILNIVGREGIKTALVESITKHYGGPNSPAAQEALNGVNKTVTMNNIAIPAIEAGLIGIGAILFVVTLFESYKKKNFAKLSGFAPLIIGIGAFMAIFQIVRLAWSHNGGTFDNPGGIFQFINNFLLLGVYFAGSMQVSRIRRTFIASERIEKIKNSPQYQQAQAQMNAMQNGGQAPMGNPYGPMGMGTPTGAASVNKAGATVGAPGNPIPVTPVETISKERKALETMSVAELKKVAKKLSISGYSTMKKPELIKDILRVTSSK